jgi:hypothetical protein
MSIFHKTPKSPQLPTPLITKVLNLEPSFVIPIDTLLDRPGRYLFFFNLSNTTPLTNITIDIFLKPVPDSPFVLYQHILVDHRPEQPPLWDIQLPYCAGVMVTAKQVSFKAISLPVYVWEL